MAAALRPLRPLTALMPLSNEVQAGGEGTKFKIIKMMKEIKNYLLITDDVFKVIIQLYPSLAYEIMDTIDALGGVMLPVDGYDTIANEFVIVNFENFSVDVQGNIMVQDGGQQYKCNNIIIIGDITDYLNYANKNYDVQKLSIIKHFFKNLMRYGERIRDDVFKKNGIAQTDTQSIVIRIDGHYYYDLKSLEAYLK